MAPRLPPRGFSDSSQEQPRNQLHPYRRITGGECFVISSENCFFNRSIQGHWHARLPLFVNLLSLLSQLFIKRYAFVPILLHFPASLRVSIRDACYRAPARLFIADGHSE